MLRILFSSPARHVLGLLVDYDENAVGCRGEADRHHVRLPGFVYRSQPPDEMTGEKRGDVRLERCGSAYQRRTRLRSMVSDQTRAVRPSFSLELSAIRSPKTL